MKHIPDGADFFSPEHASMHRDFGFNHSAGHAAPPFSTDKATRGGKHAAEPKEMGGGDYARGSHVHMHPHGGHVMHEERYEISEETAKALNDATRIVAVGTTVTRVLESQASGKFEARSGRTDIFIHPPYSFRRVGALLTNFHLPCSTLLMLVSAFAGKDLIRRAYAEAVKERYRFYSYGDCMLLL